MHEENPRRGNGYAVARDLIPRLVSVAGLSRLGRETRKHPSAQITKVARSIEEWRFVHPILIDQSGRVIDGWVLVEAAKELGLKEVPAVAIEDLSEAQLRALRHALNRIGQDTTWDPLQVSLEFEDLLQLDPEFDLTLTGFDMGEIDVFLAGDAAEEEDEVPEIDDTLEPITKLGDIWILGDHRIICGSSLVEETYQKLLGEERAQLVVSDAPYNVSIPGHVSGHGATKHENFQMASGEMSVEAFTEFLKTSAGLAARFSVDGSLHFWFMDWRHQREILTAGHAVYDELKNLVVWSKSNAGMGSLYRSAHELVYVFKRGKAPHVNNVQLGKYGRNRTNVWDYPSATALAAAGKSKLSLHPTAKPVALVADAIRDCSNRGDVVVDPFGGAGTTLIAAERTGRRARLIEIEPRYVDVTVERWQRLAGKTAIHAETGKPFRR